MRLFRAVTHRVVAFARSIDEPPEVVVVALLGYVAALVAGVTIHTTTDSLPWKELYQDVLHYAITALLVGGATIGAPTAWLGEWWLERVGAFMCLAGTVLLSVAAWGASTVNALTLPVLTPFGLVMATLLMLGRFLVVRRAAYSPARDENGHRRWRVSEPAATS